MTLPPPAGFRNLGTIVRCALCPWGWSCQVDAPITAVHGEDVVRAHLDAAARAALGAHLLAKHPEAGWGRFTWEVH